MHTYLNTGHWRGTGVRVIHVHDYIERRLRNRPRKLARWLKVRGLAFERWEATGAVRFQVDPVPTGPSSTTIEPGYLKVVYRLSTVIGITGGYAAWSPWTGHVQGAITVLSRYAAFVHEVGHTLGLDHNFPDPTSVMSYSGEQQPNSHDITSVNAVYAHND